MEKYDLVIIGAGPAGLTAGIYAARYKLNVIILSKDMGGLAATAHRICNFPSYEEIGGMQLMERMTNQALKLGVKINYETVLEITKNKEFIIKTSSKEYSSKKVIFAGGTERKKLNVPGEEKLLGRGVSYCATCDAAFFKNKIVSVVGGSDAALTAALLLSEYAEKVFIIYRQKEFSKAEPAWVDLVRKEKKIKVLFEEEIKEIMGEVKVEEIKLSSGKKIKVDGVFVEIGSVPKLDLLNSLKIRTENRGYILVNENQETNVQGFYAAGDITNNELKQIVTASAGGAIAAYNSYKSIKGGD